MQRSARIVPWSLGLTMVLFWPVPSVGQEARSSPSVAEIADALRNRLEAASATGDFTVAGRPVMARQALPSFYQERAFSPAWTGAPGARAARSLIGALKSASDDGLDPEDYHFATLERLLATRDQGPAEQLGRRVDLDLLLTDAFLVFGSHLLHGRVNPETVNPEWTANRRNTDMAAVLRRALDSVGVEEALAGLRAPQDRHRVLKDALKRYRDLADAGGWSPVPVGVKLEVGARDARVAALRARLVASGDLPSGPSSAVSPDLFDSELEGAVRRFQARHGLDVDGVVGQATLDALNVPVEGRIRQLEVNLERWRWLPQDLGRRHIEVNIADFRVDVVEEGRSVLQFRAVVGRTYRQTPGFTGRMTYLVFSPYWHVPPGIAANDKVPELRRRGGAYLAEQRMMLLEQSSDRPVDPTSVDWANITGSEFNRRYRLRQDPGPWNALGGVKFMFPNQYNVYLHDTPSRELFARTQRSFSSGCIRIERPAELAEYLLAGDPAWPPERIRTAMQQDREQTVRLGEAIPVHVLYWTAWADAQGTVHFREDLYGRDATVARALASSPAEL